MGRWDGGCGNRTANGGRPSSNESGGGCPDRFAFSACLVVTYSIDDGPAVHFAEIPKFIELFVREVHVPIGKIFHGVVKPFLLVIDLGFQDATAKDMTKEFVSCLVE